MIAEAALPPLQTELFEKVNREASLRTWSLPLGGTVGPSYGRDGAKV